MHVTRAAYGRNHHKLCIITGGRPYSSWTMSMAEEFLKVKMPQVLSAGHDGNQQQRSVARDDE